MRFIYSDPELLAVDKPAGMPSQPDDSGDPSLVDLVREELVRRGDMPAGGDAFLGLLHRLDRPTSGLVLLARTRKAAAEMSERFRRREVGKEYLAVAELVAVPEAEGRLEHHLAPVAGGMRVYRREKAGAKPARLAYRLLARSASPPRGLFSIRLETGVKHQIRAQFAFAGMPVVGDHRYGPFSRPARPQPVAGGRAILLHAHRLAFAHPADGREMRLAAPPPDHWRPFLSALPGAPDLFAPAGEAPWPR